MKIIAKEGGIATLTVVADETRPLGGYYLPELFRQIGERYSLQSVPTLEQAAKDGAKFRSGVLRVKNKTINISELSIFNDGFNATATDTDDSLIVVNDLFTWLKKEHQYREPTTPVFRTFQSDLIVEFDVDPSEKLQFFAPIMKLLQEEMYSVNNVKTPFQFHKIGLAYEGAPNVTEFVIERRVGRAWSDKRYFCKAHVTTAAHIRVLELLDKMLLGKA